MQLKETWLPDIRAWAEANDSIQEVWLFGSRAREDASDDSDVDLAITLMPPKGNHDWAFGNYQALGDKWQKELEAIVGRHVSLEVMPFKLLWRRGSD